MEVTVTRCTLRGRFTGNGRFNFPLFLNLNRMVNDPVLTDAEDSFFGNPEDPTMIVYVFRPFFYWGVVSVAYYFKC